MNRGFMFAALLIAIFAAAVSIRAGHPQKDTATAAPATETVKSAPEMDRLKFYIGEWDYTENYEKSPSYPSGGKNTGVYSSTPGPGGNSLVQHFHSLGPMGDFEGLIVMTWDPKEKAYKGYLFGNDFPGCVVETGQFEGDTLVYRAEFSIGAMKFAIRNTTKLVAPGKISSSEYLAANGAPERLLLTVEATKK